MKKRILCYISLVLIITILAPMLFSVPASAAYNDEIDFRSEVVYMENLDQNTIIFNKNSDMQVAPASLTKITTCMVVLDNCDNLDAKVKVKQESLDMLIGTNSSTAGTKAGEILTVRELLNLMMVRSANEATLILADYVAGSVDAFVEMMNTFVSGLGCKNTHYVNTHGLDADNHYTTAEDLAIIIKYALQNDTFKEIVGKSEYVQAATNKRKETKYNSTNNLLLSNSIYYYEPCKGIKTGSTTNAGYCLASYATKNGYTYLCIIMKAPMEPLHPENETDTFKYNWAFKETKQAYEWAFSNIKLKTIASKTDIVDVVDVSLAKDTDHVRLVPAHDVSALMPATVDSSSILIEPVPGSISDDIRAPIKAGDILGQAEIKYAGATIATVDLVAGDDVSRSAIATIGFGIKHFLTSKFMRLVYILLAVCILIVIALRYYNKNIKRKKMKVMNGGQIKTHTAYSKNYKGNKPKRRRK